MDDHITLYENTLRKCIYPIDIHNVHMNELMSRKAKIVYRNLCIYIYISNYYCLPTGQFWSKENDVVLYIESHFQHIEHSIF